MIFSRQLILLLLIIVIIINIIIIIIISFFNLIPQCNLLYKHPWNTR